MKASLWLVALTGAALAGCATGDLGAAALRDGAAARDEAARRSRFESGAFPADDAVAPAVRELLAHPLSDDAAVRIAMLNDRELRAAYERLGVARAELVQASLLRNPVLVANSKRFDDGTEIEANVVVSLLDAFFLPLRKRMAEADFEAEKLRLTRRLVHAAFDVRRTLVEAREAQALVGLRRDAVAIAEASQRLARRLFDAGNVTGLAMAREDANAARARLDLHAAEMHAAEVREDLNVALGLWGADTTSTVTEPSEEAPRTAAPDRVETRAVAASLDLEADRAEIDRAAQAAGLLRWEGLFPQADAGVAAKRESGGGWGFGPEASVELPVFDTGAARVAGAAAGLREKLAHYHARAVAVRSAARRLRERVVALEERESYTRAVYLAARERVVHETLLVYNAMQVGAFDVLLARRQEVDALRELLDTRRAVGLARLDLEELLAGVLDAERVRSTPAIDPDGADLTAPGGEEHAP